MKNKRIQLGPHLITEHFLARFQERFQMGTGELLILLNKSKRIKKCKLNKYRVISAHKRHRHGIRTRFYVIYNILFIKHGEVFVTCFHANSYGLSKCIKDTNN